ncbi:MAG: SDR family oxidoreductase [Pseudomonadota bacterium]
MADRRVATITGGATGVGAACAEWFARRFCNIVIAYRASADAAAAVARRCEELGSEVELIQANVAHDADCRKVAQAAAARWGRIDFLVNSAGTTVFRPMADLAALESGDFLDVYAVNVVGPYQMVRAAAPHMPPGSAIINVSSIAGTNGTGSSYAYAASKGALNTLTLALARNLAPDIRVNAVLPGMIEGRWLRDGIGEEAYHRVREDFAGAAALGRVATPADIAETVGWLALSAMLMTGQLITADAGLLLGKPPKISK